MKRSTFAICSLVVLLVGSNLFWAYRLLDAGVSYTYLHSSLEDSREVADRALAVLKETSRETATRESIIAAAVAGQPGTEPFEKDGFVWVGNLGLRFNDDGKLIETSPPAEVP